ncbi:MAG TPA: nucleoside-diphosphate sugar epimerase/dehydratase [Verrucomicrobiae bacterium]|nr:nucleoside-diphosphate sugar epimerase/dehydratase [Verrucomicrobiae bacterium]
MSILRGRKRGIDLVSALPPGVGLRRAGKFLLIYSSALTLGLWLAFEVRFDLDLPPEQGKYLFPIMAGVVPLQLFFLYAFHQFHLLPAYFGIPAMMRMVWAMFWSGATLALVRWRFGLGYALPFGVILIDMLLGLLLLSSMCYVWRLYRLDHFSRLLGLRRDGRHRKRRVAIIGAGNAGLLLAQELRTDPKSGLEPVAFFDDDPSKWGAHALDIPVLGPPELLANGVAQSYQMDELILSIPSARATRIKEILELIRRSGLEYKTVPSLAELAVGKFCVSHLRNVQIEDLLGREPVRLQREEIRSLLAGRRVMVTGAGGSIGSELSRQAASYGAAELLLVERSEVQLFAVEQDLIRAGYSRGIRPLVADILDERRMRHIFETHLPELVFHAAAHKHVPMMESQPDEAIQNNVFGTAQVAKLSIEHGVERFVLISTDKAINPTSVMGASKRLAEMVLQDLQARNHTPTRLMAVRFGNVLGSSGSVVPLFKEQIAAGGPVTVTHPLMTRYFMTIPEAVGLVLQSTVEGNGGEIFVLDMGEPVRIVDLAKQMIQLYGFEPGKDIQVAFIGTRPGEKLFEEISYSEESVSRTTHPKIMRLRGNPPERETLAANLELLQSGLNSSNAQELKILLNVAVPEYQQQEIRSPNKPNQPEPVLVGKLWSRVIPARTHRAPSEGRRPAQ